MAYLTHTAYQTESEPVRAFRAPRVLGAAVVLALVAGCYAAMLHDDGERAPAADAAAAKSDRLVTVANSMPGAAAGSLVSSGGAQSLTDDGGQAVIHQDSVGRTTTVVRGASVPLSASSPYPGAR